MKKTGLALALGTALGVGNLEGCTTMSVQREPTGAPFRGYLVGGKHVPIDDGLPEGLTEYEKRRARELGYGQGVTDQMIREARAEKARYSANKPVADNIQGEDIVFATDMVKLGSGGDIYTFYKSGQIVLIERASGEIENHKFEDKDGDGKMTLADAMHYMNSESGVILDGRLEFPRR